jgi:NAD(P)-dependent dehydrogenase (short-subunit alcohol dehydrogenase family)
MFASALTGDANAARSRVAAATPLGRVGTADDIAQAALFLCSEAGAYLTGVALPVDGGRTVTIQEPAGAFQDAQGHG